MLVTLSGMLMLVRDSALKRKVSNARHTIWYVDAGQ